MAGVNKAILIGNLGRDPEIRYLPDGRAVVNFTIATSEEWKDKITGQKREKTEWHKIVVFGKLAEIAGQYLTKGKQVYVEGKIQTRSWEQDGTTRFITEIVADQMRMLGGKGSSQQPSNSAAQNYNPDAQPSRPQFGPDDNPSGGMGDDIPF